MYVHYTKNKEQNIFIDDIKVITENKTLTSKISKGIKDMTKT